MRLEINGEIRELKGEPRLVGAIRATGANEGRGLAGALGGGGGPRSGGEGTEVGAGQEGEGGGGG